MMGINGFGGMGGGISQQLGYQTPYHAMQALRQGQPMQGMGGLLGGAMGAGGYSFGAPAPQSDFERMAHPYAQWAGQQLNNALPPEQQQAQQQAQQYNPQSDPVMRAMLNQMLQMEMNDMNRYSGFNNGA